MTDTIGGVGKHGKSGTMCGRRLGSDAQPPFGSPFLRMMLGKDLNLVWRRYDLRLERATFLILEGFLGRSTTWD